jgi:site-specific recombinase
MITVEFANFFEMLHLAFWKLSNCITNCIARFWIAKILSALGTATRCSVWRRLKKKLSDRFESRENDYTRVDNHNGTK